MPVELARWDAAGASPQADDVFAVYDAVFGDVPDPAAWRESPWGRHLDRPGFRLVTGRDRGALVGFAWGYTGERGQYWSDLVASTLTADVAEAWVGGHFEVVELAVLPTLRRAGLGGRLHDTLLARLPHDRALLGTTAYDEDPAVRLYRGRGWRALGRLGEDVQVMGLRLGR